MPERETSRQAAERELLAVREEVRQLTENMRARLADEESTATDGAPHAPQQPVEELYAAPQQRGDLGVRRTAADAVAHVPQQHDAVWHVAQQDGERDGLGVQRTGAGALPRGPQQAHDEQEGAPHHQNDEHGRYDELDGQRTATDAAPHVSQQRDEVDGQGAVADAAPHALEQSHDEYGAHAPQQPHNPDDELDVQRAAWRLGGAG